MHTSSWPVFKDGVRSGASELCLLPPDQLLLELREKTERALSVECFSASFPSFLRPSNLFFKT